MQLKTQENFLSQDKISYSFMGLAMFATMVVVAMVGTTYMAIATLSYFLMLMGMFARKKRNTHYKLMGASIFIDFSLVLILEFTRHAVETAVSFKLNPLQQAHIYTSSVATAFYIPIVILGLMRLKGKGSISTRKYHMTLGILAFIFRSFGFVLMFSLIK